MAIRELMPRAPLSLDLEEIRRSRPGQGPGDWQDELERRRTIEQEYARSQQLVAWNLCPTSRVVDREHLRTIATEARGANRSVLIRNRLVARGLVTVPVSAADLGAWFQLDAATLRDWLTEELWWDPPAELLDGVHPEYRHLVVGPR